MIDPKTNRLILPDHALPRWTRAEHESFANELRRRAAREQAGHINRAITDLHQRARS